MTYPLPPHPRTGRPHESAEAFCLMLYRIDDGSEQEWIWNSRDGVTPFGVRLRSGKEAAHVEWHLDRYMPNHVPKVGDRVFVDMTPDRALEAAQRSLDRYRKQLEEQGDPDGMLAAMPSAKALAFENLREFWPHAPALVEVTAEMQERFRPPVHFFGPPRAG